MRLLRSGYVRSLATLLSGNVIAQVLPVLILPLLTRLYAVSSFGHYSIWLGVVLIIAGCLSARLENALAAEPRASVRHRMVGSISVMSALLCLSVVLLLSPAVMLVQLPTMGDIDALTWLAAPLTGLVMSVTLVRQQMGMTFRRYRTVAGLRVVTAGSVVLLQVTFALFGWRNTQALITSYAAGAVIGMIVTDRLLPLAARSLRDAASIVSLRSFVSRHRDYYRYSGLSALILVSIVQFPLILIGMRFGAEPAAFVSIVYRAILSPTMLIRGALAEVYRQRAGALFGRTGTCRDEFMRTVGIAAVLALMPLALVVIGGPDLFGFLFGERWRPAFDYAWRMLPLLAVSSVAAPVASTLMIARRNLLDLWIQVALFVCTTTAMLLPTTPLEAILAYATAYAAVLCVQLFLGFRVSGGLPLTSART